MRPSTEILEPFLAGTIETFKVQCGIEIKAEKPQLVKSTSINRSGCLIGVIGLASESFNGCMTLMFKERVFLDIVSKMFNEKYESVNEDVVDGVGELLNIITGFGKTELRNKGIKIETAIPTVIRGKDVQMDHLTDSPVILIPIKCEFGTFYIEVGWQEREAKREAA